MQFQELLDENRQAAPAEQGVAIDLQRGGDSAGGLTGEEQAQGGELALAERGGGEWWV